MKALTMLARIDRGEIVPMSQRNWDTAMKILEGKQVSVKIGPRTRIRSDLQNRYLWGGAYKTWAEDQGWTDKETHAFFGEKFLSTIIKKRIVESSGEVVDAEFIHIRSTTDLTTVEFIEYYRKIIFFAAEHGVYISEPNEEEMWQLMKMVEEEEKRRKV